MKSFHKEVAQHVPLHLFVQCYKAFVAIENNAISWDEFFDVIINQYIWNTTVLEHIQFMLIESVIFVVEVQSTYYKCDVNVNISFMRELIVLQKIVFFELIY